MNQAEREKLYAEQMGAEALERQKEAAKAVCKRCGVRDGHHPLCPYGKMAETQRRNREGNA